MDTQQTCCMLFMSCAALIGASLQRAGEGICLMFASGMILTSIVRALCESW